MAKKSEVKADDGLKRLAYIGNICIQWSGLEGLIAIIIWHMLGLNPATGKMVTGGMDMQPRLNMAVALARHLKAGKPITDALISVRKAIQDGLDQRRNVAVHGVTQLVDGSYLVEMHRGKWPRTPTDLPVADLEKTANDINDQSNALYGVFRTWAPSADITAKMRRAASETVSVSGS